MPRTQKQKKTGQGVSTPDITAQEWWFGQYVSMGSTRSIRLLLESARQRLDSDPAKDAGITTAPSERTLFRWSSAYGWDRRAREEDIRVAEEARKRLLERRSRSAENRIETRLAITTGLYDVVRNALTIRAPNLNEDGSQRFDVADDGGLVPSFEERPAAFRDYSLKDWLAITNIFKTAAESDRADLGTVVAEHRSEMLEESASGETRVLGIEALGEMAVMVGKLVGKLDHASKGRVLEDSQQDIIDADFTEHEHDDDAP